MTIFDKINNIDRSPLPIRSEEEIQDLVTELMEQMTLKEKIGQLYQAAPEGAIVEGLHFDIEQTTEELIRKGQVGSILSLAIPEAMYFLQELAVNESRLGIPLFFASDIIHGCRTAFPINLAMSCSFDENLIEEACKIAARETSKKGIHMTFSPMVDITRDPRWGRVMETNGEDPYVSRRLAKAYIKGYQQDHLNSYDTVASCVKHFAAYGASEAGRDYNTVDMSDRHFRMFYLPPYKACVDSDAQAIMSSFNIFNGVPATANKYLLDTILRKEWNYTGFTISDYTSTSEIMHHKIASTTKDVAKKCINAGLDHEMVANSYIAHLEELINEKTVDTKQIDAACRRILAFKYRIGLFDNPYKNIYNNPDSFALTPSDRKTSLEIAKRSIVLLKNEHNTLPIPKSNKLALVGPLSDSKRMIGPWAGYTKTEECVTFKEGLENTGYIFSHAKGCHLETSPEDLDLMAKAIEVSKNADYILLAIGEDDRLTGEARSRSDIGVTGNQLTLAKKLKALHIPIITVVFSGRPLELQWFHENTDAVIQAWWLGNEAGNALASVISGDYNPSGKLTISFPYNTGQIPIYYNHFNTGRPMLADHPDEDYKSRYVDVPNTPLYSFGHGLSYTSFSYENLHTSSDQLVGDELLDIWVDVTNTGKVFGEEVVQLYIECLDFSVSRPLKELKGFTKIALETGEKKQVHFQLDKEDLSYLNIDNEMTPENTNYRIYVGTSSTVTDFITVSYRLK